MQNFVFLFFAYTLITLAFLAHTWGLARKQKRLTEEVEMLKKALEAKQRETPGPKL
ncbi:MAG: hypothetical protein HY673_02235 [Chloroflexi bacterium]|nr:hypothetical protein [Chloroflexota bacterium]